ncbi:MAG: site-specific DNA-methyltransferase [Kofleriaceae bacterium]|jgi:adenine-specific DNA-methyltransferase|nr:site-specific DNA-methyltransferase [Kofleriaceae bacterium]MBP9167809.1 site-specific DNA-methyltransferase [Kofleriaceae bacterium]
MATKNRLELTWIGKDDRPRLEPRILLEEPERGHHRPGPGLHDNRLIFGDNLLALKALEQEFTGKVKCIYIDPPFNTGQAFEHYDDGVEHSLWLSLMRDRCELLWRLLAVDGSLWFHCDDSEQAYAKVMLDEVCGRERFVSTVVWQGRYSRSNDASLSLSHNYVMIYAREPERWKIIRNRLERSAEQAGQYKNPDGDPKGPWRAIPWDAPNVRPNLSYKIVTPTGKVRLPPPGRHWSRTEAQWKEDIVAKGLDYYGKSGDGAPSFKQYLSEAAAIVPNTWWPHEEVGHTDEAKKEGVAIFGSSPFATPKPERLLQRIIHIATNPGDLVLDSFAGSGTTGAVAHKMGRRWIMVELGEHCHTHIIPRLRKVVDGEDPGGVTEATGWQGGGGFRYFRLAPSLLEKDPWGEWVVSKQYNAAMLAEAVCKHEGFRYEPSQEVYWQHGRSTERDYLFVTTQTLTRPQLTVLSEQVGPNRSLLICCGAFRAGRDEFANLTLKKIPQAVLHRCEWGKDDYSLHITEALADRDDDEPVAPAPGKAKPGRPKVTDTATLSLFDGPGAPPAPAAPRGRGGKKKS